MRTKHLCVLIHIRTKGEVGTIKMFKPILCLEEHSVYYSNEKQILCACFCLTTGLNKFYHTSAQMDIPSIKCVLEEL